METLPLTCAPSSNNPRSSKKRTSSPDAPATSTKKTKIDSGQGHSNKDRRRKRWRKQRKQPIARGSGAHESSAVSGSAQNVPSSSLRPTSPLPLASRSTATQLSLASYHSDSPFDRSFTPPPSVHLSPVLSPLEQRSTRKEHVKPTPHSEYKVRLLSVSVSNGDGVQTHHSLFTTTKNFLRPLYPLSCVKSGSIYSTNPSRFPLADMSHATAVLSTGSTLISNLMDCEVEAFSAKQSALIAVQ